MEAVGCRALLPQFPGLSSLNIRILTVIWGFGDDFNDWKEALSKDNCIGCAGLESLTVIASDEYECFEKVDGQCKGKVVLRWLKRTEKSEAVVEGEEEQDEAEDETAVFKKSSAGPSRRVNF